VLFRSVEAYLGNGLDGEAEVGGVAAAPVALQRALRRAVVGPLERNRGRRNAADLRLTVEAYLGNGLDRAATARALHIHPNTLDRRLDRVEAVCGLRLNDVEDLTRLHLALLADRLDPGPHEW